MSINTTVGNDYIEFFTSETNYTRLTKNSSNGIIDLSSFGSSTVLFKNATDPVDAQDLATKAYVLTHTGSVPGGTTGSIQFNNTTFSGTTELLYDGVRTITIGSQENTAIIQAPTAVSTTSAGGSLSILSGSGGSTSGSGGNIIIASGTAISGTDGTITLSTSGTNNIIINDTSVTYLLPIYEQNGTEAAPSYSFSGDQNTGMYSDSADSLGITIGGTRKLKIDTDFMTIDVGISSTNGYILITGNGFQNLIDVAFNVLSGNYWNNGVVQLFGDTLSTRPSYSNGTVTINKDGLYYVGFSINSNGISGARAPHIFHSGTGSTGINWAYQNTITNSADRTGQTGSSIIKAIVGDTINIGIYISGGGTFMNSDIVGYLIVYRIG